MENPEQETREAAYARGLKLHREVSLLMDYDIVYDYFIFEGGKTALWRVYGQNGMYKDYASDPTAVQDIYAAKALATARLNGEGWFLLPVRDYYLMYYWIEGTEEHYTVDSELSITGPDLWEYEDDMIELN